MEAYKELGVTLEGIIIDGITSENFLAYMERMETFKPKLNFKEYTFIIFGKSGATGKTTLCNALRDRGYNAFDISEDVSALAHYNIYGNDGYIVDMARKVVVIILNKRYIDKR
jgi:hypothetical protein